MRGMAGGEELRHVQVIDGAGNCAYDIYALALEDFAVLFPKGRDVEFIEDILKRIGRASANQVLNRMWARPVDKKKVQGIHGTLFYGLRKQKAEFYPNRRETDLDGWARPWRHDAL